MKLLFKVVMFLVILPSSYAANQSNYCSVETRTCGGALRGGNRDCGYNSQIAFVNCGKGDVFKILARKNIQSIIQDRMSQRGFSLLANLNGKNIYGVESGQDICYAEIKHTQVGGNVDRPEHLRVSGYAIDCSGSVGDNFTVGELKSITLKNDPTDADLKVSRRNPFAVMKKHKLNLAQELPFNKNENNRSLIENAGIMFGNGDKRYSGYIFEQ